MNSLEELKEIIVDNGYEGVVVFDNPSYYTAFVGIIDGRAVYEYNKMVEFLMNEEGMKELEAMEFIDYNTVRALPYIEDSPLILNTLLY